MADIHISDAVTGSYQCGDGAEAQFIHFGGFVTAIGQDQNGRLIAGIAIAGSWSLEWCYLDSLSVVKREAMLEPFRRQQTSRARSGENDG